jgi:hypothetical protein
MLPVGGGHVNWKESGLTTPGSLFWAFLLNRNLNLALKKLLLQPVMHQHVAHMSILSFSSL